MVDYSLWSFFANASFIVKSVMLLLLAASIISWTFIIQRYLFLRQTQQLMSDFEQMFWSGSDLNQLFHKMERSSHHRALAAIFISGFKEYNRLRSQTGIAPQAVMEGVQRAMRVARNRELDKLEMHLSFLATVGSTSPYIGLFGTVWGIMTAFQSLGHVESATIAMVAPGISEALIATAMGLFAAIPAVIAYNRYVNRVDRIANQIENFEEEFFNILHRQVHSQSQGVA
ncbi:MAG: protein TolQ [Legionellales bacterium]|nr:protein TolQ [Legionellales bacterium]